MQCAFGKDREVGAGRSWDEATRNYPSARQGREGAEQKLLSILALLLFLPAEKVKSSRIYYHLAFVSRRFE